MQFNIKRFCLNFLSKTHCSINYNRSDKLLNGTGKYAATIFVWQLAGVPVWFPFNRLRHGVSWKNED